MDTEQITFKVSIHSPFQGLKFATSPVADQGFLEGVAPIRHAWLTLGVCMCACIKIVCCECGMGHD